MSILKTATSCWRQAAEAEIQAAQITDQHLKAIYLRIAHQWSVLARSYEFADSAEHFLLDAKRTKDGEFATAERRIGPLAVVARESRGGALAKASFRSLLRDYAAGGGGTAVAARSRSCLGMIFSPRGQRAAVRSLSLGAFGPHRMTATAQASGA